MEQRQGQLGALINAMYYWNKDNFEGLAAIAEDLRGDDFLAPFARYCDLRQKGLRKPALLILHEFVSASKDWSFQDRRTTANRLLLIRHNHPSVHQLLPQPLIDGFICPTLREWRDVEPDSAEALRWIGVVFGDRLALEKALLIEPRDDIARRTLITALLYDVDYATHHLVEGRFIGEESVAETALGAVKTLLDDAFDRSTYSDLQIWFSRLRSLLNDWTEYCENSTGDFPEWCARRGHHYEWPIIVYYNDRRAG